MVTIDIAGELSRWLSTEEAKKTLADIFREVFRAELKTLLMDDLVDCNEAARILNMSTSALRKAVERGQISCIRVGRRVRFQTCGSTATVVHGHR